MTPEEIEKLSNEQLLNKALTVGHDFIQATGVVEINSTFYLLKDLKREILSRMQK